MNVTLAGCENEKAYKLLGPSATAPPNMGRHAK